MVLHLPRRDLRRVLVGHPAGIHGVHVNAVHLVIRRRGARHHVQSRLRHVRVRMPRGLVLAVKLPFHRRDVHDVLVALGRAQHERFQPRVQNERRNRVHQLHFQQFHGRHFRHGQPPRIALAQIHLLQILVKLALREERLLRREFLRQQRHLRKFRRMRQPRHGRDGLAQQRRLRAGFRENVISAQAFVGAEQFLRVRRQIRDRPRLAFHHVLVKIRRPAHGLAGVIDDEIQPVARREQMPAERLHAGRVPQVQSENLQPVAPFRKIRFRRVAPGRVAREARGHDQLCARPQQLDARLIADLHPSAGEQRHAPAQVRRLRALAIVQRRALGAELVVKMMDGGVILLADVAVLRLDHFAELRVIRHFLLREIRRRQDVRRGEDRLAAQRADAGLIQHGLVALGLLGLALAHAGLHQPAARIHIRTENIPRGLDEARLFFDGELRQQAAIVGGLFQQFGGGFQPRGQGGAFLFRGLGMGRVFRHQSGPAA